MYPATVVGMSTRVEMSATDEVRAVAVLAVADLYGMRHPEEFHALHADLDAWIAAHPGTLAQAVDGWYRHRIT